MTGDGKWWQYSAAAYFAGRRRKCECTDPTPPKGPILRMKWSNHFDISRRSSGSAVRPRTISAKLDDLLKMQHLHFDAKMHQNITHLSHDVLLQLRGELHRRAERVLVAGGQARHLPPVRVQLQEEDVRAAL